MTRKLPRQARLASSTIGEYPTTPQDPTTIASFHLDTSSDSVDFLVACNVILVALGLCFMFLSVWGTPADDSDDERAFYVVNAGLAALGTTLLFEVLVCCGCTSTRKRDACSFPGFNQWVIWIIGYILIIAVMVGVTSTDVRSVGYWWYAWWVPGIIVGFMWLYALFKAHQSCEEASPEEFSRANHCCILFVHTWDLLWCQVVSSCICCSFLCCDMVYI